MVQKIFQTNAELKDWLSEQNSAIIFIPTMGGLHYGHQYLIEKAKERKTKRNQIILVSIFVNPLQFSKDEDFSKYPRNLNRDAELAFSAGADAIWAPDYIEVFPGGEDAHFKIQVPPILNRGMQPATFPKGLLLLIIFLTSIVYYLSLKKPWKKQTILPKNFY